MDNDLKTLCKTVKGSVVTFGMDEKYTKFLEKNQQITTLDTINLFGKKKNKMDGKAKEIPIKKVRKYFKKKKIDVIFYQADKMEPYLFSLPKEIIYIGKRDLYIIGSKDSVIKILPKFERYVPYKEKKEYNNKILVQFNIEGIVSNRLKDSIYFYKDKLDYFIGLLQDFLTS